MQLLRGGQAKTIGNCDMKWVKRALLSAVFVSTAAALANAAGPMQTTAGYQPQVATNAYPYYSYSYGRLPGPKASGDNWIPSPYASAPAATTAPNYYGGNSYYPGQGFGPQAR